MNINLKINLLDLLNTQSNDMYIFGFFMNPTDFLFHYILRYT